MWLYEPKAKKRLYKIPISISYQTIGTQQVQQFLKDATEKKYWLCCDCSVPQALMFLRKNVSGEITLVNHSQFGVHDKNCEWYSSIKGSPREIHFSGTIGSTSDKRSKIQIYRNFASDLALPASPSTSTSSKPNPIDSFVRLIWQLFDDSFLQLCDVQDPLSPLSNLMKVRDTSDSITLGGLGKLKKHLFVDAKGFNLLKSSMRKAQGRESNVRHQSVLLVFATHLEFRNETLRVTNHVGEVFYVDNVVRNRIKINRFELFDTPCLLAMSFCYESSSSDPDNMICVKWFVQPIVNLIHPVLINSNYEKMVIDYCISYLSDRSEIQSPCIYKPLAPFYDKKTDRTFFPSFVVSFNRHEKTYRFAVFIQESDVDIIDIDDDDVFTHNYDSVALLKLFNIQTVETLKTKIRLMIDEFIH